MNNKRLRLSLIVFSCLLLAIPAISQNTKPVHSCRESVGNNIQQSIWWTNYLGQNTNQTVEEIYLRETFNGGNLSSPLTHYKHLIRFNTGGQQQYFVETIENNVLKSTLKNGTWNLQAELGNYGCVRYMLNNNNPPQFTTAWIEETALQANVQRLWSSLLNPVYDHFLPQPTINDEYFPPQSSSGDTYMVVIPYKNILRDGGLDAVTAGTVPFDANHLAFLAQFYADRLTASDPLWEDDASRPRASSLVISKRHPTRGTLTITFTPVYNTPNDATDNELYMRVQAQPNPDRYDHFFRLANSPDGILEEGNPLLFAEVGDAPSHRLGLLGKPGALGVYWLVEYQGTETKIVTEFRREQFTPYSEQMNFLPIWTQGQ